MKKNIEKVVGTITLVFKNGKKVVLNGKSINDFDFAGSEKAKDNKKCATTNLFIVVKETKDLNKNNVEDKININELKEVVFNTEYLMEKMTNVQVDVSKNGYRMLDLNGLAKSMEIIIQK